MDHGGGLFPTQQHANPTNGGKIIPHMGRWVMKMKEYSSSIALWFGGVTAGLGALTLSDWALITGIICTLGTFALNWYYKQKELQLRMGVGNVTSPEK